MKVLFLTIGSFPGINDHGIYPDLLREFMRHGHEVYVVRASEKRTGMSTVRVEEGGAHILRVRTGNITQTNLVEKGISTILIKRQYLSALKKHYQGIRFDLVLYPTPPITLCGVVEYVKKRDGAKTYLLLKDIFPQNAVDVGMMNKKGILYRYFRKKEKKLYELSDTIGCMSQANVDYVLKHNPELPNKTVEVCPNSVEAIDVSVSPEKRREVREKYGIPMESTVFVYGGNLGRPQGIDFLIDCLKSQKENPDAFFLIAGNGTEFSKMEAFVKTDRQKNVRLMGRLEKRDYERMVGSCDVGMLFLDHRFTIPNFPSRLLDYMEAKIPVIAVTDPNTDVGDVIVGGGFGWWCESNDVGAFQKQVDVICRMTGEERAIRGNRAWEVLQARYSVSAAYRKIWTRVSDACGERRE